MHRSTAVVVVSLVLVTAAINFGGHRVHEGTLAEAIEHGWPWRFLRRERPAHDQAMRPLSVWPVQGRVASFRAGWLAWNLALAAAAVVMTAAAVEWRRRHRSTILHITLRDLFALTLMVAVLCAAGGYRYRQTLSQRDAVAATEGSVAWQTYGHWFWETLGGRPPGWFADVVGIESRGNTGWLSRGGLDHLPQLRVLTVAGSEPLDNLTWLESPVAGRLERLSLNGVGLTASDLLPFASLASVQEIDLSHNDITDEGLVHLERLKRLKVLELVNNPITDEGIGRLQRAIPGLQVWDD